MPDHLKVLNNALMDVAAGRCLRLMINMPPRHGKSEFTSKYFPAWYLGRWPDRRIILASYEASFAGLWGRRSRDLMDEFGPQVFGVRVKPRASAANWWEIEGHEGGMGTCGVGSGITGKGAHVLLIDDPVKDAEQARSETYREKAWDWYTSTAYTRLEADPQGAVILIMTRWDEDDLAGRLLREMKASKDADQWRVIDFPALAGPNDPLGRKEGEALWPERYPVKRLQKIKTTLGSYWFEAEYQQKPAPAEGNLWKRGWWRFWIPAGMDIPNDEYKARTFHLPIRFDEMIQSWDMTFKDTKGSDFVAGGIWARRGANKYLLDQVHKRMDFSETLKSVKGVTEKWPKTTAKYVEDAANGPAVISVLKAAIVGLIPVPPTGSKEARAFAVQPQIEAGNVYLPHPSIAPWVDEFLHETATFPNGAHDDQVDQTSQALLRLDNTFSGTMEETTEDISW